MDADRKRLSEPFFLKKILLEKCSDASDFTTMVTSVHAIMLESGFVLFNNNNHGFKFSYSNELLTVSLRYTLPARNEYVTLRFQTLSNTLVVYGSLSGYMLKRVHLDMNRFISVIELVLDTLKFEKQAYCSTYRDVFVLWRMVKDGLSIPLLMALCHMSGLEPPPSLMRLPTELKMKILELISGQSVAVMACVCTELRDLASDNELWRHKCVEEANYLGLNLLGYTSVSWKEKFLVFWQHRQKVIRDLSSDQYATSLFTNADGPLTVWWNTIWF